MRILADVFWLIYIVKLSIYAFILTARVNFQICHVHLTYTLKKTSTSSSEDEYLTFTAFQYKDTFAFKRMWNLKELLFKYRFVIN